MPQQNTPQADTDAPVRVTQQAAPKPPKGTYVKYIGVATHRVVRPTEWPASIKSSDRPENTLVWDASNGHMLSTEKMSEDVLKCIKDQGDFVIVESGK